ncbi:AAA family ATPase [Enterovibrio norvegicus]|uniref:AAA family ATPase n=1 Tax=Enterovibrio norvegicus TaxID=188144 RepID=UPI0013CF5731|nr:AAA family ATPase [Enterovibrio norvegicus]
MIISKIEFDDKSVKLCNEEELSNGNVFSVVIGVNASGKSRLLNKICNILMSTNERLSHIYPNDDLSDKDFYISKYISKDYNEDGTLHYLNYTDKCQISYRRKIIDKAVKYETSLKIDNHYHIVPMPKKLISVSNCLFDKFPKENKKNDSFYSNKSSSNLNTNSKSMQISNSILNFVANNSIHVKETLNMLNLESELTFNINVHIKTKTLLGISEDLSLEVFDIENTVITCSKYDYALEEIDKSIVYESEWQYNIEKNKKELVEIQDSIKFFLSYFFDSDIGESPYIHSENKKNVKFKYNQENTNESILNAMKKLLFHGIISTDDLSFFDSRNLKKTRISEKSSGELCYLHMITAIASEIRNNSIILIDEPELSLHPKWQSEFIPFISKLFSKFNWCHFIFATHSPHIVSSLSKVNSFVVNMTYDSHLPIKGIDVHNKSMDYQMAKVFGISNPNNEYLIRIAINLFTFISTHKSMNKDKMDEYIFLIEISKDIDAKSALHDLIMAIKEMVEKYG